MDNPLDSLDHTLFLALNAGAEPPAALVALAVLAARFVVVLVRSTSPSSGPEATGRCAPSRSRPSWRW